MRFKKPLTFNYITIKYKDDEVIVTSTDKSEESNSGYYRSVGYLNEHLYVLTYLLAIAKSGFDKPIRVHIVTKFQSSYPPYGFRTVFSEWYDNILKLHEEGKYPYRENQLNEILEEFKTESPFI